MKKTFWVFVLSIAFNALHAQNNYVEVSATDTVQLYADYFVFRINVTGDLDYGYNADTTGIRTDPNYYRKFAERQRQKQQDALKAIEIKLKELGFLFEPVVLSDLAYRNNATLISSVSTHSLQAVAALNELVKTEKGLGFSLTQIGSSQEEIFTAKLMQKLMTKARARANELARISGKKITGIISVSDRRNDQPAYVPNGMALINSLSIDRQKGAGENSIYPAYPLQSSLFVRFAWQ
jgi:hypothetical protein